MSNQNQIQSKQQAIAKVNDNAYYPSKQDLSALVASFQTPKLKEAIKPGFIARTDGFEVDKSVDQLERCDENNTPIAITDDERFVELPTDSNFKTNQPITYTAEPVIFAKWFGIATIQEDVFAYKLLK